MSGTYLCSSKMSGPGSRRKGFMHALEGIIAAIVLFFYFSSASFPPLQKNEWTYNSMKQSGAEYLNSIDRSDSAASVNNDSRVSSKITNSLFESSDISIIERGVPPKELIVGLLPGSYGSHNYFKNISMNGRTTRIVYYTADLSDDISQFDVLLLTGPPAFVITSPQASKLKKFLLSGKGIVEVVNMTNSNYNSFQGDLFGLENKDAAYEITRIGDGVRLSESMRSLSDPLKIHDYFLGIVIKSSMTTPASPPYDVLYIGSSPRVGFINLTAGSTSIAIAKIGGDYDSLYVDSNGDYNFSKPLEDRLLRYGVGSQFNTSSGNYTVKAFGPGGAYVEVLPSENARLAGFYNPLKIAPNESSWTSAEQDNVYNISSAEIGSLFTIALSNTPLGDTSTLPYSVQPHKFSTITQFASPYNDMYAASTNVSGTLFLNVDINKDTKYNGAGEGPFVNGDIVGIGPENYRIEIAETGLSVKFKLYSRDGVSAAIASAKYSGRTVWMPDIDWNDADSLNYLASAVLWAAPKDKEIYRASEYHNIISSKKVFIPSGDTFQPYVLDFSRRYQ